MPQLTTKEVLKICSKVKVNKALSLGGIPKKVLTLTIKPSLDILVELFGAFLVDEIFPEV